MCGNEELFAGIIRVTLHGSVLIFALWLIIADSEILHDFLTKNNHMINWII